MTTAGTFFLSTEAKEMKIKCENGCDSERPTKAPLELCSVVLEIFIEKVLQG